MKKLLLLLSLLSCPLIAQNNKNIELSIALVQMTETDNLYFAEINRYFYVGDALITKAEVVYYSESFSKNFGVGMYINIGSPWYDGFGETSMTEIGPVLKWKIKIDKIVLVPTLYVGYRYYDQKAGDGLGINFSGIIQYPLDKFTPFLDLGFFSQPAGGNDATDITYAPVFGIGGGISVTF